MLEMCLMIAAMHLSDPPHSLEVCGYMCTCRREEWQVYDLRITSRAQSFNFEMAYEQYKVFCLGKSNMVLHFAKPVALKVSGGMRDNMNGNEKRKQLPGRSVLSG